MMVTLFLAGSFCIIWAAAKQEGWMLIPGGLCEALPLSPLKKIVDTYRQSIALTVFPALIVTLDQIEPGKQGGRADQEAAFRRGPPVNATQRAWQDVGKILTDAGWGGLVEGPAPLPPGGATC